MSAAPHPEPDPGLHAEITALVAELAGDWDYEGEVGPDTRFLTDLGLESLDLVVMGTSLQERYGTMPFAEFLAALGARPVAERDVTIGELVDFVAEHRRSSATATAPVWAAS